GSPAVVFPLKNKFLNLSYFQTAEDFNITTTGVSSSDLEMIIWSVLEKTFSMLNIKRSDLRGHLIIDSHIQFGAGMGASATLAVGISQFFGYLGFLNEEVFSFSKKIEDLFHGESSGVDVAIALHQKPLVFKKNQPHKFLDIPQLPKLFLSYSGQRGVTKDCVTKVKNLFLTDPELAQKIDADMKEVVEEYIKSGGLWSQEEWVKYISLAQSCFKKWGLVPEAVQAHIDTLLESGALACKITGSGFGGYVLSLWAEDSDFEEVLKNIKTEMIPVV
ncbi:MAG: mevalonate kinase, partial [Pseudobdellovibrio sp.]